MSFATYDFKCPNCGYIKEEMIDLRGCETDEEREARKDSPILCPNCEDADMERMVSAPNLSFTKKGSSEDFAGMRKSFKERFVKSGEADQVAHRFGSAYHDAIRGGAVDKIKKTGKVDE